MNRSHLRLRTPPAKTPIAKKPKYTKEELKELAGKPRVTKFVSVADHRLNPEDVERRLKRVRWVVDVGVTARGCGDDRRAVAFVVLEPGRLLGDVEADLVSAAYPLPVYARPKMYTQVARLPRDPVLGHLDRTALARGRFEDRVFPVKSGKHRGRGRPKATIFIRNPINEIRFEGVVAFPVMSRRSGDPADKVRKNEARVTISHSTGVKADRPRSMCLTFTFYGKLSGEAKELEVGDRVCITGKVSTELSGRQFVGLSFVRVEANLQRTSLAKTDDVIEALL